jgi:Fe-S cluster biogenesis protein NfuA
MNIDDVKSSINKILEEKVRPYLLIDKGDIELIDVDESGIVTIKFIGACFECPIKPMTLRGGVERAIMQRIPEVKRVEEGAEN